MKILDKANIVWGVIATVMTGILGEFWFLFLGFLVLNLVDYITGVIKARMFGQESSARGAKGIMKKVMYWLVIGIAFFVSTCFVEMGQVIGVELSFVILFGWLTLATYMINEIRSILENCVEMGVDVPYFLIKGLDITSKLIQTKTEEQEVVK